MPAAVLEFAEADHGTDIHLSVRGELDLATAPTLTKRLAGLLHRGRDVRIDLSELAFMDLAGARAIGRAARDAEFHGRSLHIEPHITRQVRLLFTFLRLHLELRRHGEPC